MSADATFTRFQIPVEKIHWNEDHIRKMSTLTKILDVEAEKITFCLQQILKKMSLTFLQQNENLSFYK